jgi:hypothetical protein
MLASDSLACWRKPRDKALVRHRFRGLLPFASAVGPSGKKGDAAKSGRPQGFVPSLIMLRIRPAPHALRLNSLLRSLENHP